MFMLRMGNGSQERENKRTECFFCFLLLFFRVLVPLPFFFVVVVFVGPLSRVYINTNVFALSSFLPPVFFVFFFCCFIV